MRPALLLLFPLLSLQSQAACSSDGSGDSTAGETDAGPESPGGGGGEGGEGDCQSPLGGPFDPATLAACCPEHGGAHCVPGEGVDAATAAHFAACDGGGLCVPDTFLEATGAPQLVACTSVGEEAGVCLSLCLPEVADNQALLPQDVCADHERCVPCVSPLDGMPTGVCELDECEAGGPPGDDGGDDGGEPPAPERCCQDRATCVPAELTGEQAEALAQDSCPDGELCVPDELIDGQYEAEGCSLPFLGDGACMPECLGAAAMFPPAGCADGSRCVPCRVPGQGETGACEFLP